jgi:hypothetical protein
LASFIVSDTFYRMDAPIVDGDDVMIDAIGWVHEPSI